MALKHPYGSPEVPYNPEDRNSLLKKLGPQKLMTYESTFFPDRKTPAAIKIQNLEAAVFYSIFSHRQFNRQHY